ncbi:MAG: nitroreductase family deazaflavin-dependent oxidoreductase [Nitrososphaerota archaeon]|nr:nitroreductase family deazaflavin-dependent oxidoreductase [Nitrososphaerota archaeon]
MFLFRVQLEQDIQDKPVQSREEIRVSGTGKVPVHSKLASSVTPSNSQKPERRLTILLISTAVLFAFIGTSLGAFMLAHISGVPTGLGLGYFAAHPYVQIYGFVAEFVVGVAYSLLPRFKGTSIPNFKLGYIAYALMTAGNILFLFFPILSSNDRIIGTLAPSLIFIASVVLTYHVSLLAFRPVGGFLETNLLVTLCPISLALISVILALILSGVLNQDAFSPAMIFLSLSGFAGSMIYTVEIRSVSFRQCNYRKNFAKLSGYLQASAIGATFLGIVLSTPALALAGALLYLSAALAVILSIRILELAHPLMYRPAMTKSHFAIVRYNEVCILSGSFWLIFGCILGVLMSLPEAGVFFIRDSFIHSIAIGFIGSSITCFSPILLPGLLGRKAPITGLSFWPITLLNAGIVIRVAGNFDTLFGQNLPIWESISGPLVLAAMISVLIMLPRIGKTPPKTNLPESRPRIVSGVESISNERDATLTVFGRKTNREIIVSVWFAENQGALHFVPRYGRSTKWYRNVRVHPNIKVKIADHTFTGIVNLIDEKGQVRNTIRLFKDKYGDRVYKNTYGDKIDCAVILIPEAQ